MSADWFTCSNFSPTVPTRLFQTTTMKGSRQSIILYRQAKNTPSGQLVSRIHRSFSTTSEHPESRKNAIAFIGLGAMGREMASNLFTKTASAHEAVSQNQSTPLSFVVCDANSEAASSFARSFRERFPSINVHVADNPGESVKYFHNIVFYCH